MSSLKKTIWFFISGICGILSPIFAFSFIFLAITSYELFNWELNALSDLGVVSGITATFFNYGLIGGGLISLVFARGLFAFKDKTKLSRFSLFIFILACISLIAIGLFPENIKPIHYIVSVAFFVFLPISLILSSVSFGLVGHTYMALFSLFISIVATTPWILYFSSSLFNAIAIPEAISGFAVSIWTIVIGLKMVYASSQVDE